MTSYNQPLKDKKTALLVWLDKEGLLKELYQEGIITPKAYKMLAARVKVVELMSQGVKKSRACERVARMMCVTPKAVYTYIRD